MDKNTFFQSAKPKISEVKIGQDVFYVKHLSITETLVFESQIKKSKTEDSMLSVLVSCVCDSQGNALLSEDDKEQIKTIDSNVAVQLYKSALSLNQMDESELEALKKTKEQPTTAVYLSDGTQSAQDSQAIAD